MKNLHAKIGLPPFLWLAFSAAAEAAQNTAAPEESALESLQVIALLLLLLTGLGLGLGAFGFLVNHTLRKRTEITGKVLRTRPGLSLTLGVIITGVGFGLVILTEAVPALQLLLMLAYLLGLGTFCLAALTRQMAQHMEKIPAAGAYCKAGLALVFSNAIPILGNIFFLGLVLAGIGAALLGFFVPAEQTKA